MSLDRNFSKRIRSGEFQTASHWGTHRAVVEKGRLVALNDFDADPAPNPIGQGLIDAVDCDARIRSPLVRKSYLDAGGPSKSERRGIDAFVPVDWEIALDLAAGALRRVISEHGNSSIFGGSYGWASAGRFHHAQSQVHRFLNCLGGYVRSETAYSNAAAKVILPYVVYPMYQLFYEQPTIEEVAEHAELVVAFGGLRIETAQVGGGGVGRHMFRPELENASKAGVTFINISAQRDDCLAAINAEWVAPRPNTDVAIMLGIAHTLHVENLVDDAFLHSHTIGYDKFVAYLNGKSDGVEKTPEWASGIADIATDKIRELARRMAKSKTLVTCALSLQRADHGEQPIWMTVVLAAMLGQIGNPGCGFGIGIGSDSGIGVRLHDNKWPAFRQGENPVPEFIPVARIADMLLNPGTPFNFDGGEYVYPDIKLIYWAGGNPFHHHQDLNRLVEAFRKPETVIVNEIWSTATTHYADIVLPVTSPLEREDICIRGEERTMVAMHQALSPIGNAKDDYWIFTELADRLGHRDAFTEGKDSAAWINELWQDAQKRASEKGFNIPDYDTFREQGTFDLPPPPHRKSVFQSFREDQACSPLPTPSGKIEIFSETISSFGYADCPGHPVWLEPFEWLGDMDASKNFSLHLISNQPKDKLHSQLDMGRTSRARKVNGREPALLNPVDAEARGLKDGDLVEVFNDRGACISGVQISDSVRQGVCVVSTGAWFDPEYEDARPTRCKNGNPNILTRDQGCSSLSQGPAPMTCLVEVRRIDSDPGEVTAYDKL